MKAANMFLRQINFRYIISYIKNSSHTGTLRKTSGAAAAHAAEVLCARPAVVAGAGGFAGGTLGFILPFHQAFVCFLMIQSLVFLGTSLLPKKNSAGRDGFRTKVLCLIPGIILGTYCLTHITYQYRKASAELGAQPAGGSFCEYDGYIVSPTQPGEGYNTCLLEMGSGVRVCFGSNKDLGYGSHVRIQGRLSLVPGASNPGGFDQRGYYSRQGIYLILKTYDNCIRCQGDNRLSPGPGILLSMIGVRLRGQITDLWGKVLDREDAALLGGMILGDTSGMTSELKNAFRMCGLSHLTAVSGANVAYFMMPLTAVFRRMSGKRYIRSILASLSLVFFGFLTGWSPSVTRALFMAMGSIASSLMTKRHDPLSAMFLTACILMFWNPYIAVDYGFLLSFCATLSLVLFSDPMERAFDLLPAFRGITKSAASLISVQIGMLPWLICLSAKESALILAVNLAGTFMAEGISTLCLPLSALLPVCTVFSGLIPVARFLFIPLSGLLFLLREMAYLCADKSVRALRLSAVEPLLLAAFCLLLLSLLMPRGFFARNIRRAACILLTAGIAVQIASFLNRPECTVIFADVGQGDCTLILLNNGKSILIDGGGTGSGEDVIIPMLNYYGIVKPDITILTHLHRDHGGGIAELAREGRVTDIYSPCLKPNEELAEIFSMQQEGVLNLHSLAKGDRIVLSENTYLDILSPDMICGKSGNEESAVALFRTGCAGILFMGDAGEETESKLINEQDTADLLSREVDFLKVGHHGSRYATQPAFLAVFPLKAAVISVGENNYGHPSPDTLERLESSGADIYRTDFSGAVVLKVAKDFSKIYSYGSR